MFRLSDLIELPIKPLKSNGSTKHSVKSVLIDGCSNRAVALVCKEGTIKKYLKVIPYEKIIAIDIDGVIVADESCIRKTQLKEMKNYIEYEEIVNKTIIGSSGNFQGILTDIFINLLNGKIVSYEISEGYLDDFVNGRKVISANVALGNNASSESITMSQRLN